MRAQGYGFVGWYLASGQLVGMEIDMENRRRGRWLRRGGYATNKHFNNAAASDVATGEAKSQPKTGSGRHRCTRSQQVKDFFRGFLHQGSLNGRRAKRGFSRGTIVQLRASVNGAAVANSQNGPVWTRRATTRQPPISIRIRILPLSLHAAPLSRSDLAFQPWEPNSNDRRGRTPSSPR